MSISYLLSYVDNDDNNLDRIGGLPSHLPLAWPNCMCCRSPLSFIAQLYHPLLFDYPEGKNQMGLQLYTCVECHQNIKDMYGNLLTYILPDSASPNSSMLGIESQNQKIKFVCYEEVADPVGQWEYLKFDDEEMYTLADKYGHLNKDKIGGLFICDDEGMPEITPENLLIAQIHIESIDATHIE